LIERVFNSIVLGFERDLGRDVDVVSVGVMVEKDECRERVQAMDGDEWRRERERQRKRKRRRIKRRRRVRSCLERQSKRTDRICQGQRQRDEWESRRGEKTKKKKKKKKEE
jgi:hypothetical protein